MEMKKTLTAVAISTVLGTTAFVPAVAQAFSLGITAGSFTCNYGADTAQANGCKFGAVGNVAGSVFLMGGNFANSLSSTVGLEVDGVTSQPHVNATNPVDATNTGNITEPWLFFSTSQFGINFSTAPIVISYTDGTNTTAEIDMSGWRVAWSADPSIDMGAGAPAAFTYDNTAKTYSFDYTAVVPSGGFSGTQYDLHLEGTFAGDITTIIQPSAIPVPAAVWLFGSGLLGLVGVARRKRQQA